MLNAKAFAHAATLVTVIFYVICVVLSFVASDLLFAIGRSWMHSINLESVKATVSPDLMTIIWGLVTISAVTWVTTYAVIVLYNKWAK